jgi:uncharacterized protein with beta-barrel porin domain
MMRVKAENTRGQLRLSASVLAVAVAFMGMTGAAEAQVVPLTPGNTMYGVDSNPGQTIEITSGTDAVFIPADQGWVVQSGGPWDGHLAITDENWGTGGANNMTIGSSPFGGANGNAAAIQVDSGASLRFVGLGWGPWFAMNNMIHADGDVIFEGNGVSPHIIGTNSFLGNLTLLDGAQVYMGETWGAASPISFSNNTTIGLGSGSMYYLRLTPGFTSTAGRLVSTDATGLMELASGTLVLNGANTAAAPFTGTLQVDTGATIVVGDATHPGAIFGDPNHTNGSAETLNINGSIGGAATLKGYGTVYAAVNNAGGIVQPGGTANTPGTLTVSSYTQSATGTLKIEVTPTGASQLHVLGNAALGGSLIINITSGQYGTDVFDIVSASSVSGSFNSIQTTGNVSGAIAGVSRTTTGYQVVTEVVSGANAIAPVVVGHLVTANLQNVHQFAYSLYDVIAMNSPKSGAANADLGLNLRAWIAPFGRMASISRNQVGYDTTTGGVTAGLEYRTANDLTLGVALSFDHDSLDAKGDSNADTDAFTAAVYGGGNVQNARVDGMLFYNSYDATAKRKFGSTLGTAEAKPSGFVYGGSVQVSRGLFDDFITPYIRGIYSREHQDGVAETGGGALALKFDAINANSFVGDVGLRINPLFRKSDAKLKLEVTVALQHDFSKLGETVGGEFATISGSPFTNYWSGDSENTARVGLDVSHQVTDGLEIFGRVNGQFSLYRRAGEISVGGRYRF